MNNPVGDMTISLTDPLMDLRDLLKEAPGAKVAAGT